MSDRAASVGEKIIVVVGMSRGGTNLLWNIVQSHPAVIDSYYELNEIFGRRTGIGLIEKLAIECEAVGGMRLGAVRRLVRSRLTRFAEQSFFEDEFNREKAPGVPYEPAEFSRLIICTKLVSSWETDPLRTVLRRNDALKYLPLLRRTFEDVRVLFLVRNGLAVAEGWGRRGAPIDTAAFWYRKYIEYYEGYVREHPERSLIVRFEDLLTDPFESARRIYSRLSLSDTAPESLRIAIKPTIRTHQNVVNSTQKTKRWINRENWMQHIDATINEAQIAALSAASRERFACLNRDILARHRYL